MTSIIELIKSNKNKLELGKLYSMNEFYQIVSPDERANIKKNSPITFSINNKKITLNLK